MIDLHPLLTNPLFTGGAALGLIGGLMAWARDIPGKAITVVKRQFIVSVEVEAGSRLFYMLSRWLNQHEYTKRSRLLSADVQYINDKPVIVFTPAPGDHVLRFKGTFIWLLREREKTNYGHQDAFKLKALGRDQVIFRDLFEAVEKYCLEEETALVRVHMAKGEDWEEISSRKPRALDSVILKDGVMEALSADLVSFKDSWEWYCARGLPYRRGYLLYGPAGNGKSSSILALAGHIKMDLYILSLAHKEMNDRSLMELLISVPDNGIVLLEDVDKVFEGRDHSDENSSQVTFSGLLNALDGVATKDGQVVVMTTNHIDKLDPALIRPGRVDLRVEIGNATPEQASRMFARFFPGTTKAEEFGNLIGPDTVSMATIQGHLLNYKDEATVIDRWRTIEG